MFKYSELRKQHITYIQLRGAHLFHRLSPPHAWYHIPEGTSLERRLLCFVSLTIAFPCRELLLQIVKLFRSHRLHYLEQPFLLSLPPSRQITTAPRLHCVFVAISQISQIRRIPIPVAIPEFRPEFRNSAFYHRPLGHNVHVSGAAVQHSWTHGDN